MRSLKALGLGCLLGLAGCTHDVEGQGPIRTEAVSTEPRAGAGEACDCESSAEDPRGDEACCAAGLVCRSEAPVTCSAAGCGRSGVCVVSR